MNGLIDIYAPISNLVGASLPSIKEFELEGELKMLPEPDMVPKPEDKENVDSEDKERTERND